MSPDLTGVARRAPLDPGPDIGWLSWLTLGRSPSPIGRHQLGEQGDQIRGEVGSLGRQGHGQKQPMQVSLIGGTRSETAQPHLGRSGQRYRRHLDGGPGATPGTNGADSTTSRADSTTSRRATSASTTIGRTHPGTHTRAGQGHRHVGDAQSQALDPQAGHVEEGLCRGGKGPEAILPLGPDVADLGLCLYRCQAPVGLETHVLGGHVGHREVGGVGQIE